MPAGPAAVAAAAAAALVLEATLTGQCFGFGLLLRAAFFPSYRIPTRSRSTQGPEVEQPPVPFSSGFMLRAASSCWRCPALTRAAVPAVQGKVYWAAEGQGAWVREAPGQEPKRLQAAEFSMGDAGLAVVASASHLTPETQQFVDQLSSPVFKQLGSSLKLLMVREYSEWGLNIRSSYASQLSS